MDEATLEAVRAAVRAIPAGETSTYGEVAAAAGIPGRARLVGRILADDGHDLPWHRVLRADGTCAPHIATEQLARLRAEGVILSAGRAGPHAAAACCVSMARIRASPRWSARLPMPGYRLVLADFATHRARGRSPQRRSARLALPDVRLSPPSSRLAALEVPSSRAGLHGSPCSISRLALPEIATRPAESGNSPCRKP